jgi:hypothetical protein
VVLHAQAGERLAARLGKLGYLARELADEVPSLLEQAAGETADAAARPSGSFAGGLRVER